MPCRPATARQQIQKLEEELGERLFDRLKSRARLIPTGAFLQHLRKAAP